MAKNRVASDRPYKSKDNFFKKSHKNFVKSKFQHKNKRDDAITPSTDSNNFFITSNNPVTSVTPKISKVQDFVENNDSKKDKKPFDKKKYRLQKYSKKYQLQQWEDKRKKAVLLNYYKTLKEDESNPSSVIREDLRNTADDTDEKEENDTDTKKTSDTDGPTDIKDLPLTNVKNKHIKPFRKAHQEFQRIREEKEKKKEIALKNKLEKEEALQTYKKKKFENFKKLNKKTKKGQPIMKDRIEMLLEKIQNSIK